MPGEFLSMCIWEGKIPLKVDFYATVDEARFKKRSGQGVSFSPRILIASGMQRKKNGLQVFITAQVD